MPFAMPRGHDKQHSQKFLFSHALNERRQNIQRSFVRTAVRNAKQGARGSDSEGTGHRERRSTATETSPDARKRLISR